MEKIDRYNFYQVKEMEPEDVYGDSNMVNHQIGEYVAEKYLATKDQTVEYMGGIILALVSFLIGCATSGFILYLSSLGKTPWMQ